MIFPCLRLSRSLPLSVTQCTFIWLGSVQLARECCAIVRFFCEKRGEDGKKRTSKWILKMPIKTHPNLMFGHRDRSRSTDSALACVGSCEGKKVNWLGFIYSYICNTISILCTAIFFRFLDFLLSHLECFAYMPFQWYARGLETGQLTARRLVLNNIFISVNMEGQHIVICGFVP